MGVLRVPVPETSLTATEDFNHADGPLLGATIFTHAIYGGTWTIDSNQAKWSGPTPVGISPPLALLDVGARAVDITFDFTVGTIVGSPNNNAGIGWNVLDENNLYWLDVNTGGPSGGSPSLAIYKKVNGVFGIVASVVSFSIGTGTYRLRHAPGGAIDLWHNGTLVFTGSSPLQYGGHYAGIHEDNSLNRIDNFSVASTADGIDWMRVGCSNATLTTGRLRLWTGIGWVREACDDDTGFTFTDDFNRADSATTLGGPWVVSSGEEDLAVWDGSSAFSAAVWGISSNRAYNVNSVRDASSVGHPALAVVDAGSGDIDMSVTLAASVFSSERNNTGVIFRADPVPDATEGRFASYYLWTTGGTVYWKTPGAGLSAVGGGAGFVAAGSVMRVLAVGSSIELYVDGSLVWSLTSSNNATAPCHGLGGNKPFGNANRWDDFSLTTPAPVAHPLKIEDPANPGTWITVACMVPV